MKKYINDIYLIVTFAACSLIQADIGIFEIDIKTIFIVVCSLIFLISRLVTDKGFADIKTEHIDIAVYASGALSLAGMLYKLIVQPQEFGKYMTLMSLCILCFVIRNYYQNISADRIFLVSILNAVTGIFLLYHYIADTEFVMPVSALVKNGAALSWLVLMIAINVLGFCIYDNKGLWYGANAVVGFFLLFIQNNMVATVIAGSLFLQIALRYMPRKKIVRRNMQMFFAYSFLLCNMTLITNYTEILNVKVSYDLELSVYIELILAVFAVCFFNVWDKFVCNAYGIEEDDDTVLVGFRAFYKKTSIIAVMFITVISAALIRGDMDILPEVFGRFMALCREGLQTQTGIIETAVSLYGIIGGILTVYFIYSVFDILRKYRHFKTSIHKKLFRIVSWIFAVQALFLTQSMTAMPLYIIFTAVMLNECNAYGGDMATDTTGEVKGEGTNETDNSNSMLQ